MGGGKSLIIKRIATLKTFLLLLFFTSISLTSFAQIYDNCLEYELNNDSTNTVTLVGYVCPPMPSSIVIPNSFISDGTTYTVTRIQSSAFRGITTIQTFQLPKTLKTIDQATFQGCTGLTMVTIEDDGMESVLDSIYPYAFKGCTNLRNIQWPSNLSYIGENAFDSCSSLVGAYLSFSGVTQLHSETFANCTNLSTLMLPSSLVAIDSFAFKNCISLTDIEIPVSTTNISNKAFMGCNNLEDIYVSVYNTKYDSRGTSVAIIESATDKLILGCKNSIIPDNVKTIGSYAFYGCDSLTSITIPSSVTSIGNYAFGYCHNFTSITLQSATPPTLENTNVFVVISPNAVFYLPNTSYLSANYWSDILRNYNVVIPNKLVLSTGKWNFVAGLDNQASLYNSNNPASFVSTFTADNTINDITDVQNPHCDIAIMGYDYNTNNWSSNYLYASDNMIKGIGYFVWPFNENAQGTTITSNSTLVTVPYTPVTDASVSGSLFGFGSEPNTSGSASACYWFALGNPFSQSLSVNRLTSSMGSGLQNKIIYTYNRNNGNWITTADSIFPGEGFMVGESGAFNMLEYSIDNPSSYQNSSLPMQPENYGIRFSVNANGISSDMFAKQENNAQDGFDTKDAYALFGNNENLVEPYFVVEGRQIIHNRYNSDNYACDVNFHAQKSGVAELSVSDVPEGTTVSIVDLTMNTETVLESEPYQIEVEAGENAGRYQIKINKGSVSLLQTIENEANISIWNNDKEIFVKGENLQRVEVYNTLGQMVYQKKVSGESYNFTFANEGAYIVKAAAAGCSNGQSHVNNCIKTQKIVIK